MFESAPILPVFWDWFLKYSSFFLTAALSVLGSYIIYLVGTRRPNLIWYATNPQLIPLPATGQQPLLPGTRVGTATLFIYNNGRAPAREVLVGHFGPTPLNAVFPDIPRNDINLPGGGTAIQFPVIPPKVLVNISYLLSPPVPLVASLDQIVSYVSSEEGYAKRIPVILQRIFPPWVNFSIRVLNFLGLWVVLNAMLTLIVFLWRLYA
jgi:hypothetical protein